MVVATCSASIQSFADERSSSEITEKRIMGWVENVYIGESNTKLKAKLDTGAKTSSIHAKNIEYFKKDDQDWVRFKLSRKGRKAYVDKKGRPHPKKLAISITMERPLVRTTKIKRHKNQSMERPVVTLPIIIGGRPYEPEFTLTDRRKFIYPVLLGRRFLKDVAIVDSSKTFLTTELPSQDEDKNAKIAVTKPSQSEK